MWTQKYHYMMEFFRVNIRIALGYAALNGLDVVAADIRNTYIQTPLS